MNKKGFTLIELLAVIVILGIITLIAIPTIMGISNTIRQNMLNKKIIFIEEAAVLYGQDDRANIKSSGKKYNNYDCKVIKVSSLVPKYLDKDNGNNCLTSNSDTDEGCIVDPANKNNYLDNNDIILFIRNTRVSAKFVADNSSGSTCE